MSIRDVNLALDGMGGTEFPAYTEQFIKLLAEYHESKAKELVPSLAQPTFNAAESMYLSARRVGYMREDGAAESWLIIRKSIPFFKRLKVPRSPTRDFVNAFVKTHKLRATADFNELLAKEE